MLHLSFSKPSQILGFKVRELSQKSFDNWGCEFSDDGNYGSLNVVKIFLRKELPLFLVERMIDRKYIAEIMTEISQINELIQSIKIHGIINPGIITFDDQKARLSDGNHRFLAAKQLGLRSFPVEIVRVDKIKKPSIMLAELFPELLELVWQEKM